MDWNSRTDQHSVTVHLSEKQQYLPQNSKLLIYPHNQQGPNTSHIESSNAPINRDGLVSNANFVAHSLITNNYSGNSTLAQRPQMSMSSDVPVIISGNTVCSDNKNGTVERLPGYRADSMTMSHYTTTASTCPINESQGNRSMNVQCGQPHQYKVSTGTGNVGQQTLQQASYSVNVPGTFLVNHVPIPSNEMRLLCLQLQNYNRPEGANSSTLQQCNQYLVSHQNVAISNVQSKANFGNATMMVANAKCSNMPMQVQSNPPYPSNVLNSLTNAHFMPQQMVVFQNSQNQVSLENAGILVPNVPSKKTNLRSHSPPQYISNKTNGTQHNLWPDPVYNSASQPVQCQEPSRPANEHSQNQLDLADKLNTPANISPNLSSCKIDSSLNLAHLSSCQPLKDEKTYSCFKHSNTLSKNSNRTGFAISQSVHKNEHEIQMSRHTASEQSSAAISTKPLLGRDTVCNSGITSSVKESVGQPAKLTSNLNDAQDIVVTEEDMVREIQLLLQAKEQFLNRVKAFKEKRKLYRCSHSSKNKPTSNAQDSKLSHNLDPFQNANKPQHPSPPSLISDGLVFQQSPDQLKIASPQMNCPNQLSMSSEHDQQGNLSCAASPVLQSFCTLSKDTKTHMNNILGVESLQPLNNSPSDNPTPRSEQSEACLDFFNSVEVPHQNAATDSIGRNQNNDQNELGAPVTEAGQNYSKLNKAMPCFLNSLQEYRDRSYSNQNVDMLSDGSALTCSNASDPSSETASNLTDSRKADGYTVSNGIKDAFESCVGMWKMPSTSNPAEIKQSPKPSLTLMQMFSSTHVCDPNGELWKNDQISVSVSKTNVSSNVNEAHINAAAGHRPDSLGLSVVKAVEPQVAIVNPLVQPKSKSPNTYQELESLQMELSVVQKEDGVCSLLGNETHIAMGEVTTAAIEEVILKHPRLSNMISPLNKLDSETPTCATDNGKMVTSSPLNCRNIPSEVNQNLQTLKKCEHANVLESCPLSKPQIELSSESGKSGYFKPQEGHLLEVSSLTNQGLNNCSVSHGDSAGDEQLHISSFCTLVEGNPFYDSQIAHIFDSIHSERSASFKTSQENVVSVMTIDLESSNPQKRMEKDLINQLLPDVEYLENQTIKSKRPLFNKLNPSVINVPDCPLNPCVINSLIEPEQKVRPSLLEKQHGSTNPDFKSCTKENGPVDKQLKLNEDPTSFREAIGALKDIDASGKHQCPKENAPLTSIQQNKNDLETLASDDRTVDANHTFKALSSVTKNSCVLKEYSQRTLKQSAQILNDQLSELQKEFPYGVEEFESMYSMEVKHVDISNCADDCESLFNNERAIASPAVSDCRTVTTAERGVSKSKLMAKPFNAYCSNFPDRCSPKEDFKVAERCDSSEDQECRLEKDPNISLADISDSDDLLCPIQITVLDSEQMVKLFPEISSTDANKQYSQEDTPFDEGMKHQAGLTKVNSKKPRPALHDDANENHSNGEVFCCLYRWLSSTYPDVPKCSCVPVRKRVTKEEALNCEDKHVKEVAQATKGKGVITSIATNPSQSNNTGQLPLAQKGKKRRRKYPTSINAKKVKDNCDNNPVVGEHQPAEQKPLQPSDITKSERLCPENQKESCFKQLSANPNSGQTNDSFTLKEHLFKSEGPKADLDLKFTVPEVDHKPFQRGSLKENKNGNLCKNLLPPMEINTNERLIAFQKNKKLNSCVNVGVQVKNLNVSSVNKMKLVNKETKYTEGNKFNAHVQNEKQNHSEVHSWISAADKHSNRPATQEMHLAAEKTSTETIEPQSATINRSSCVIEESGNGKNLFKTHTSKVQEHQGTKKTIFECKTKGKTGRPVLSNKKLMSTNNKHGNFFEGNVSNSRMSSEMVATDGPSSKGIMAKSIKWTSSSFDEKETQNDAFRNNLCKWNHMTNNNTWKLGNGALAFNEEATNQSKTTVPEQDPRESGKLYLNRVAFKSTSSERIHLTKLKFGFSPGKLGSDKVEQVDQPPSEKNISPVTQDATEKTRMLEFKLCPESLFRCNSTDESSKSDNAWTAEEKGSMEGIRSKKEDWLKNIPLKKRKVDMTAFQGEAALPDLTRFKRNTSPLKVPKPSTPGSKAIFHAFRQIYLEKKSKCLDIRQEK
ncbi:retroelement silencing factor 1 [Ambystoma mexicanum]|uniref:retroelement silencing factor 1 n=1 Tax=Ambystoma mexicanum TaxID=8296 RepID=UPI0037E775C9